MLPPQSKPDAADNGIPLQVWYDENPNDIVDFEYLIGQFAAGSSKKDGEFYTPQQISNILSAIVTLESQEPKTGKRDKLDKMLNFTCGSGSLLLNIRKKIVDAGGTIGKVEEIFETGSHLIQSQGSGICGGLSIQVSQRCRRSYQWQPREQLA
jgi:hypothetical protein